ncbi:MAG: EAL domain-containing protein [Helicobacteraceae bacterium]|nr:EAL domain-containing protein [Helicobacteraceae bacterium]
MLLFDNSLSFAQKKERERKFRLSLRAGIPIFALASILTYSLLSQSLEDIPVEFFVIDIGLFAIMIYFFFFLLYRDGYEHINDGVTDLLRREYILNLCSESAKKSEFSMALISIKNINSVQEKYGFINTEEILYKFSRALELKLTKETPLGYLRGGEFLIGLNGLIESHKVALELILIKLEAQTYKDVELSLSLSIIDSNYSNEIEQLLERLYESRNSNYKDIQNPKQLEEDVLNSLKEEHYTLAYQRVKNQTNLYEVSLKLQDKDGKNIHQKQYINIINRLGIIKDFDNMLLNAVVNKLKKSENISIAVNLSTYSLRSNSFFEELVAVESSIASRVVVIINEKEYFKNINQFNALLDAYKKRGFQIALDNFGNSTTSLQYFKNLNIDIVRFDASITKLLNENGSLSLFKGLNISVKEMGYKSWIKMVENEEILKIAKDLKVDYIQGNYISPIEKDIG